MLIAYYAVWLGIILLTMPLASRKVVYSVDPSVEGYTPLSGLSDEGRRAALIGAVLITAILVVLCIFKPEGLPDREMYKMMYDMGGGERLNRDLEPTFAFLVSISPSFLAFLGIYGALSVSSHIVAIFKNSPNIWLSLFIYLGYTFILHDMVQIRAGVAIGILLVAVRFIRERKWIWYFSFVMAAGFFHYSAWVFMLFYFLPSKYLNRWIWSGALIVATIAGILNTQFGYVSKFIPVEFVQMYAENYMGNNEYVAAEIGLVRIFKIILAIVMLFNQKSIIERYPYCIPVLIFYMVSQLSYLLLSDIPVFQGRFGEMFAAFDIFALAMFPLISRKFYYGLFVVPIALTIYEHIGIFHFWPVEAGL